MTEAGPLRVFTVGQVAQLLQVSEQTVRGLIHEDLLRAARVVVALRVTERAIGEYIKANPVTGKSDVRDGRRRGQKPGPRRPALDTASRQPRP
jgi:excisionase family DNA binding protein